MRHVVTASAVVTLGGAAQAADGGSPVARFLTMAAGPVLILAALWLLLRRRSRLRDLSAPYALPRSVFAAALQDDEAALRERATEEVARLREETHRAQVAPGPRAQALDAHAAAASVLDRASGIPDLAGVFALIAEGRAALAGTTATALPLCFFHPLHGPAARRIPWRPPGGRKDPLPVAACTACVTALRTHRTPDTLPGLVDGRPVPYFEVPAAHSLWAATGYGSFPSPDSLTARVLQAEEEAGGKAETETETETKEAGEGPRPGPRPGSGSGR